MGSTVEILNYSMINNSISNDVAKRKALRTYYVRLYMANTHILIEAGSTLSMHMHKHRQEPYGTFIPNMLKVSFPTRRRVRHV